MSAIQDYIEKIEDLKSRAEFEMLYLTIKQMVPDAEEGFGYGVPAFKYNGNFFMGFAVNKSFISLYPASNAIKSLSEELKNFEVSEGSGAIRFTPDNPLPKELIKKITKLRLKDVGK